MFSVKFNQAYTFLPATIVFLLLATIATENANAQMFGNGRFLRRVRSDLFGAPESPKPAPKKNPSKSPTPAKRPSKQHSPAKADGSPGTRNRQIVVNQQPPRMRPHSANEPMGSRLPQRNAANQDAASRLKKEPVRSNAAGTLGFGMLVQLRNQQLFVTQIDPNGNSAKAGIRSGDQLVAGGGINFESLSDFNGIADILGDGDQLEFEVARAGRKKKVMVQFGETKEMANDELEINYENAPIDSPRNSDGDTKINNINTRDNNSFMPTPRNIRQAPRPQLPQSTAPSNRSISKNPRQMTHPQSSNQTIGSQRDNRLQQLQLPSQAESVLNIN